MQPALQAAKTRKFKTLWHIGTMVVADKRGDSHEGNGLSVSVHPDEWTRIAKLGAGRRYRLFKPKGTFLDFHKLTKAARLALQGRGVAHGWLALERRWQVEWYDDEFQGTRITMHSSADEALAERGDDEGAEKSIKEVEVPCLTEAAFNRLGFKLGPLHALDIAATFFVEDETALDGVWWNDTLDVFAYSAPRGVICKKQLSSWRIELVAPAPTH